MGIKKEADNGQRLSGMEEDCVGSQGPQRTVALEKNNTYMKQNGYGVPDINTPHPKIKTDCKAQ
jgi:hypothetical protein